MEAQQLVIQGPIVDESQVRKGFGNVTATLASSDVACDWVQLWQVLRNCGGRGRLNKRESRRAAGSIGPHNLG